MITKPTVLVLGAGASKPYGYPLGGELLENIVAILGDSNWVPALLQCGVDKEIIEEFKSELFLSQQPSVDALLEHRPEFRDVGKLAIAMSLIAHEFESSLFAHARRGEGIYHYLFTQLNAPWEEFANNKLSIITFNYDRTIDHYLFTALKHSYGKPDDEVAEALSSIPIIHVHGFLGPLPWQETGGRPYVAINIPKHPVDAAKQIEPASKKILIVSEEEKSTNEFNRAFNCIKSSERIYFLGFGYHLANLRKLRLNELGICDEHAFNKFEHRTSATYKHFRGSALNWRTSQLTTVERSWGIGLPNRVFNDLEFLKEYAELD